jgi:hypothetical protein
VIAVRDNDVIEVLELCPERQKRWIERFPERGVRYACHRSDLRPAQI